MAISRSQVSPTRTASVGSMPGIDASVAPSSIAPGGGSFTRIEPSGATRTRTCRPSSGSGIIRGVPVAPGAPAHMAIESVVARSVVMVRSLASTSECAA